MPWLAVIALVVVILSRVFKAEQATLRQGRPSGGQVTESDQFLTSLAQSSLEQGTSCVLLHVQLAWSKRQAMSKPKGGVRRDASTGPSQLEAASCQGDLFRRNTSLAPWTWSVTVLLAKTGESSQRLAAS